MRANQMRLYLSAMAYVLVSGLRRLGLQATELATAQASTIREKLFKIGARVTVSVRRVWLSMASSYPRQRLFQEVWANLRCRHARNAATNTRQTPGGLNRPGGVCPCGDFQARSRAGGPPKSPTTGPN